MEKTYFLVSAGVKDRSFGETLANNLIHDIKSKYYVGGRLKTIKQWPNLTLLSTPELTFKDRYFFIVEVTASSTIVSSIKETVKQDKLLSQWDIVAYAEFKRDEKEVHSLAELNPELSDILEAWKNII